VRGGPLPALLEAASGPYYSAGRVARHFARGKLAGDPVFQALLTQGLLQGRRRVVDLGCGQGLLAAWLLAARTLHDRPNRDGWPQGWPAPPRLESYLGIDINPREVARAQRGLPPPPGMQLQIVHGDVCDVDYGTPDAVVIMDVLHYIDYASQERVLERVRIALPPEGLLLLRVGDTEGPGFVRSKVLDRAVVLLRRRHWPRLYCRPIPQWQALLARSGFCTHAQSMGHATFFTNVLLIAHAA
jgi:SAM-dependent methyltransferase